MKKTLVIGLILTLAFAMTGCGSKPETAIDNFFSAVKNYDSEAMKESLSPDAREHLGQGTIEQYLTDSGDPIEAAVRDYLKSNAEKITYEVTGSEINGDEATVTVKCKFADGSDLFVKVIKDMYTLILSNAFSQGQMTNEQISQQMQTSLEKNLSTTDVKFIEKTIDVDCIKVDGEWYVKTVSEEMLDVVTSNLFTAAKGLSDSFGE